MNFKPLTYSIGTDSGVNTLCIKDTTDYSGIGNKSLSAYSNGLAAIYLANSADDSLLLAASSKPFDNVFFNTESILTLSSLNNTDFVSTIPLFGITGNIDIYLLVLPALDITTSGPTTFMSGDMFVYYNTSTSSYNLYMCMVDNPDPTINGEIILLPISTTLTPNRNFNVLESVFISEPISSSQFQVSLEVQIDCAGKSIVVSDSTNYSIDGTRPSLEVDAFSFYTKLYVNIPDGRTILITIGYPAYNTMYDVPVHTDVYGDGLYVLNYINVPLYNPAYQYQINEAVVDSLGQLYINNYGNTTDIANFTQITEAQLPSKYKKTKSVVYCCQALSCSVVTYEKAFCGNCGNCERCCENKAFIKTAKTGILLDYLNNSFTPSEKEMITYKNKVDDTLYAIETICQY